MEAHAGFNEEQQPRIWLVELEDVSEDEGGGEGSCSVINVPEGPARRGSGDGAGGEEAGGEVYGGESGGRSEAGGNQGLGRAVGDGDVRARTDDVGWEQVGWRLRGHVRGRSNGAGDKGGGAVGSIGKGAFGRLRRRTSWG